MEVLQVNTQDVAGGAERIAMAIHHGLEKRQIGAQLMVGHQHDSASPVKVLPDRTLTGKWKWLWSEIARLAKRRKIRGVPRICSFARALAEPGVSFGIEKRHFPASHELLSFCDPAPDLIHFHNLHGDYFDLRALVRLSRRLPVIVTLHDAWMLSGHCAHSFDCDRWKSGCGKCPDLTIYPPIQRDATRLNWTRKSRVYSQSNLCVATPCQWLMDRVHQSMLNPAIVSRRVIPNGVDLRVFRPLSKNECRQHLRIRDDVKVVMFAANGVRHNPFKDFQTLQMALRSLGKEFEGEVLALAVGETASTERIGNTELRFIPFVNEPSQIVPYYCASDVYLHPARAETFGLSILEAMACGTPVIATAVGGIPELVRSSAEFGFGNVAKPEEATGILVPVGDAEQLSRALHHLLSEESVSPLLSKNAIKSVTKTFTADRQIDAYVAWYKEILFSWENELRVLKT